MFAASMKWTMTDNKKAVADISGTEPVARGEAFSRKSQKKKRKKKEPSNNRAMAAIIKTCTQHPPSVINLNQKIKKNLKIILKRRNQEKL